MKQEQTAQGELEKIASFYDGLGRELYKAAAMADASTEYGIGKKPSSFVGMVQKLTGKLKKKGQLSKAGRLRRRK